MGYVGEMLGGTNGDDALAEHPVVQAVFPDVPTGEVERGLTFPVSG